MQEAVRRMIASVGSTIVGISRSSTRTSPGPCMMTPRMVVVSLVPEVMSTTLRAGLVRRKSLPWGVPAGHPSQVVGDLRSVAWTTEQRCASSS